MSKVTVSEEYLQDIADAIREKTGELETYTPAQMGDAIRSIVGEGGDGSAFTKLWENDNPTSQMNAGYRITLSSSRYDMLLVLFNRSTSVFNMASATVLAGSNVALQCVNYIGGHDRVVTRTLTRSSATLYTVSGADYDGTAANDCVIPIAIYGITSGSESSDESFIFTKTLVDATINKQWGSYYYYEDFEVDVPSDLVLTGKAIFASYVSDNSKFAFVIHIRIDDINHKIIVSLGRSTVGNNVNGTIYVSVSENGFASNSGSGDTIIASVTANGVKSYGTLLSELAALIPSGKHPKRLDVGNEFTFYLGYNDGDTEHRYFTSFNSGSNKLYTRGMRIKAGDTTNVYTEFQFGTSVVTDISSTVPANGTTIILYDGQGGNNHKHSYATAEHVVGTWIDGRDVYEKVVDLGALPNTTSKEVAHGITGADMYINVEGFFYGKNNGVPYGGHLPYVPSYNNSNNSEGITLFLEQSVVRVATGMDRSSMNGYAIIRYVKTTS